MAETTIKSNVGRKASRRGRSATSQPAGAKAGSAQNAASNRRSDHSSTGAASAFDRLRYKFEQTLSKGPARVIGWLSLVTLAIIVLTGLVELLIGKFGGSRDGGILENWWQALLRVLDSGTFAGDTDWPTRLLSLFVTIAGIFIAGSLIGLIATTVDRKIEDLARGRSKVIEDGHTVILGWNDHISSLVSELIEANRSAGGKPIVILASKEKSEMEEVISSNIETAMEAPSS
jgi:ion channel POLLUX/CASTOR